MKFFLLLALLCSHLLSAEWRLDRTLVLKKDELVRVMVLSQGEDQDNPTRRLLEFRWTLFQNKGLVFFTGFDGFMKQNVLYPKYPNQSIRLELISKGASFLPPSVLLIKFVKFDYETRKAYIEVLLRDPRGLIDLKFIGKYEEKL